MSTANAKTRGTKIWSKFDVEINGDSLSFSRETAGLILPGDLAVVVRHCLWAHPMNCYHGEKVLRTAGTFLIVSRQTCKGIPWEFMTFHKQGLKKRRESKIDIEYFIVFHREFSKFFRVDLDDLVKALMIDARSRRVRLRN